MAEIVQGAVGPEASYDLAFSGGALQLTFKYTGVQASMSVAGSISAAQLLGALADKLTNPTEKALLQGLEAIIASIP